MNDRLQQLIANALRPLQRRVRMIAVRALVAAVNDGAKIQLVQVSALDGERLSDVQRLQQYGFSGNPPKGATAVMLCMGGSRSHPVVIACDDPSSRFVGLQPGESAQYNDQGDFIHIKSSGEILVKASSKVVSDAPLTHALGNAEVDGNALVHGNGEIEGDLVVGGNVTVVGTIGAGGAITSATSVSAPTVFDAAGAMQAMREIYNAHTQPVSSGTAQAPTVPM